MQTYPAYYRDVSQMIEDSLKAIKQEHITELEALEQAQSLRQQADFRRCSLDFPPRKYISND